MFMEGLVVPMMILPFHLKNTLTNFLKSHGLSVGKLQLY